MVGFPTRDFSNSEWERGNIFPHPNHSSSQARHNAQDITKCPAAAAVEGSLPGYEQFRTVIEYGPARRASVIIHTSELIAHQHYCQQPRTSSVASNDAVAELNCTSSDRVAHVALTPSQSTEQFIEAECEGRKGVKVTLHVQNCNLLIYCDIRYVSLSYAFNKDSYYSYYHLSFIQYLHRN